jgi:hypothetical protein
MPSQPGDASESSGSGASRRSAGERAADAAIAALDFERAQRPAQAAPSCAQCAAPISGCYFTLGAHLLCEPCQIALRAAKAPGNPAARALGAACLGALAAVVGSALWMVVTQLTGYEIGLIAIAVGFIVGAAVQIGARRVGGLPYQALAVFLTYSAIVMTYVPSIASTLQQGEELQQPAAAWIASIPIAYAAPLLLGFENAIGILIIAFALWQAARMNARAKLEFAGPFRLEARDPSLG